MRALDSMWRLDLMLGAVAAPPAVVESAAVEERTVRRARREATGLRFATAGVNHGRS